MKYFIKYTAATLALLILGGIVIAQLRVHGSFSKSEIANSSDVDVKLEWVRHFGRNGLKSIDKSKALITDDKGNVYVTGKSNQTLLPDFWITFAFNREGVELWSKRFEGSSGSNNYPVDIALDTSGNIFVVGRHGGAIATIKYNPSGDELWRVMNNPLTEKLDFPQGIEIDEAGNAYVLGTAYNIEERREPLIIKYNPEGIELWRTSYSALDGTSLYARGIALDNNSNVYVLGEDERDIITVKFDTNGNEQWNIAYDGPYSGTDLPIDIAVSDSGNIYVTGEIWDVLFNDPSLWEIVTLKYDSLGNEKWSVIYNNSTWDYPKAITVDNAENIYVAGVTQSDILTIKYNSTGTEEWTNIYAGDSSASDWPTSISVDNNENVYVTGSSNWVQGRSDYTTIKYNVDGENVFTSTVPNPDGGYAASRDIVAYESGVVVTGDLDEDFLTMMYDSSGNIIWDSYYDGPGISFDFPKGLTTDNAGGIVVAGYTKNEISNTDFLVVKYDQDGREQWIRTDNVSGTRYDEISAVTTDFEGNIYVTGYSSQRDSPTEMKTIKFNPLGEVIWSDKFNHPLLESVFSVAMTLDSMGNIYIGGASKDTIGEWDYLTIKYNAGGEVEWFAQDGIEEHSDEFVLDITVDKNENVYVTGRSGIPAKGDYLTIKYNSDGSEDWRAVYSGVGFDNNAVGIAVDDSGYAYVTGSSEGENYDYDILTIKYNHDGSEVWTKRFDETKDVGEGARGIMIDNAGNIIVSGWGFGNSTRQDILTIKYSPQGVEQWVQRFTGTAESADFPDALTIDKDDNIYVTGNFLVSNAWELVTIKYNSEGREEWSAIYQIESGFSEGYDIALDDSNNVIVTGSSRSSNSDYWAVITTLKYSQTPNPIGVEASIVPDRISLSQNYPNPFNPITRIEYSLPQSGDVSLIIYNLLGEEVARLVNQEMPMGIHNVIWDASNIASGIYFYRLKTGKFVQMRKMMLLK